MTQSTITRTKAMNVIAEAIAQAQRTGFEKPFDQAVFAITKLEEAGIRLIQRSGQEA
jgi:hypothetical protein